MAISSPGLGSGLDVNSIVDQLVSLEKRPLFLLQSKASTITSQLSSLGVIKAKLATLQDAAAALAKPALWSQTAATSSDITSVSVTTSGTASAGSYGVSVSQLAKSHSLASAGNPTVGTGTLRIQLGTWTGQGTAQADLTTTKSEFNIQITAEDTLASIRTKINDAKGGVTASVVNDISGARLVIRSNETGLENAIKISQIDGVDADGEPSLVSLSDFTYDGTDLPDSTTMGTTAPAQNAKAKINGLALESPSNTFKDVADGMSFTALKETVSEISLNVATDNAAFKAAITKFTSAFNDINKTLRDLTRYDAETKVAGNLQGDRTALAIQGQLRSIVSGTAGTSTVFTRLSDLGIEAQRDGSLLANDTKLTAALKNPTEVGKALASAADAPAGERGFGALMQSFAKIVTGTDGTLSTVTESLNNRVKLNSKEQERFNTRIEATRARLLRQYGALDTKMASLNALNGYVTQQITSWNRSTR